MSVPDRDVHRDRAGSHPAVATVRVAILGRNVSDLVSL